MLPKSVLWICYLIYLCITYLGRLCIWWCTHIRQHFMMCLIFLAKICLIPGRRIKVYKKGTTNKKKSWFIYYSITLPKYVELFTYSYYVGTLQIVSWYVVIFHVLLLNLLLWASLILYLDQSYTSNAPYLFKFYVKNLFIKYLIIFIIESGWNITHCHTNLTNDSMFAALPLLHLKIHLHFKSEK